MRKCLIFSSALLVSLASAQSLPHTFSPNTPAKAAEVNANFTALLDAVNKLNSELAEAKKRIEELEKSAIPGLKQYVSIGPGAGIRPKTTITFKGVNVQITNSEGIGKVDGTGNLILGYNSNPENNFCDDSRIDIYHDSKKNAQENCIAGKDSRGVVVGRGNWVINQRTGSHNLVVGEQHDYIGYGSVLAGTGNISNGSYTLVGGKDNLASGFYSTIAGGTNNHTTGYASVISGGRNNISLGSRSTVGGGYGLGEAGNNGWKAKGTVVAP